MNWADLAIIGILSLSAVISIVRGFIKEAMSLVIWLVAAVVATVFDERLAVWLVDAIATPSLRMLSAWLGLFVAVLIVGGIANYLLGQLVRATGLSGTDRLLGMIFGAIRGAIIVMVLLIVLPGVIPIDQDPWWRDSLLIPQFLEFEDWAKQAWVSTSEFFRQFF